MWRLNSRQCRLDATPIGGRLTVAFRFAGIGALSGFQHGPFAAHFVELTGIIQDFESLHVGASPYVAPSLDDAKDHAEMRA